MSFEDPGDLSPYAAPCRYGTSKLQFRGPERDLNAPYVAFLGGSETFGRFVAHPFADLIEAQTGLACVNFGAPLAGIDAIMADPELPSLAAKAEVVVLQLFPAGQVSNRLYRVHPRRNDRFVEASALLTRIYPEVDFSEVHFTGHLLATLEARAPDRFRVVRDVVQQAWSARMRLLIERIGRPVLLLWLRSAGAAEARCSLQPRLVTAEMISDLSTVSAGCVEVDVLPAEEAGELPDMVYGALQAPSAGRLPGPAAHRQIAEALAPRLQALMSEKR